MSALRRARTGGSSRTPLSPPLALAGPGTRMQSRHFAFGKCYRIQKPLGLRPTMSPAPSAYSFRCQRPSRPPSREGSGGPSQPLRHPRSFTWRPRGRRRPEARPVFLSGSQLPTGLQAPDAVTVPVGDTPNPHNRLASITPFHRRGAEARAGEHAARKRPLEAGPGPRPPGCRPQVCRKGPADTRWPSLGLGRGRRAWRSHAAAQKAAGVWALQKGCRGHHSSAPASRDGRLLPWEPDRRGPRPRQRRRHASSRTSALRDASSAPLRLAGGLAHAAAVGTNTFLASPAPSHLHSRRQH